MFSNTNVNVINITEASHLFLVGKMASFPGRLFSTNKVNNITLYLNTKWSFGVVLLLI